MSSEDNDIYLNNNIFYKSSLFNALLFFNSTYPMRAISNYVKTVIEFPGFLIKKKQERQLSFI